MWTLVDEGGMRFSLCGGGGGGITNLHGFLEMHLSESQAFIKKKNPEQGRLSIFLR